GQGLEAMGITTIGQLAAVPVAYLEARFGPSGRGLRDLALGRDDRAVERVARELRESVYAARCVTLKLRFADFSTLTRRHTDDPTQDGLAIYRRARALLDRIPLSQPVRLIGLSASGLGPATAGQLPLLGGDPTRRARLAQAMDRVVARWGEGSLRPASVVRPPHRRPLAE